MVRLLQGDGLTKGVPFLDGLPLRDLSFEKLVTNLVLKGADVVLVEVSSALKLVHHHAGQPQLAVAAIGPGIFRQLSNAPQGND